MPTKRYKSRNDARGFDEVAVVRDSRETDIPNILDIYGYYVIHTTVTMEEEAPSPAELARRRIAALNRGLPYLVAEIDGVVVGYAYATPYRPRSAYRFTVENTVYVKNGLAGRGIGKALLSRMIVRCRIAGLRQMIAVSDSANVASIRLHESQGFYRVGTLQDVGYKFGRSIDTVIMQRALAKE